MTFGGHVKSDYTAKPRAARLRQADEASMDEILDSIRAIIAEQPLGERQVAAAPQPPVLPARANPIKFESNSLTAAKTAAVPVQIDAGYDDDVLAELLDPGLDEAQNSATLPPVVTSVVQSGACDLVGPLTLSPPPETEILAAASVFGALAAGLAATVASGPLCTELPAPVVETTVSVQPIADIEMASVSSADGDVALATSEIPPADSAAEAIAVADMAVETAVTPPAPVAADVGPAVAVADIERPPASPPVSPPAILLATPSDPVPTTSHSFEDTIAAMLRPLLREWLDANMPRMVERALKEELAQPGGPLPTALQSSASAA